MVDKQHIDEEPLELTPEVPSDVQSDLESNDTIIKLQEQIDELTDHLKRVQAEFQNYVKRQERESDNSRKFAKLDLLKELLPTLDNLERALQSKNLGEELHKGIEMVYQDFKKVLTSEGVHPIEALGKPFDPTYHEVLMAVHDDTHDDGTVVEEFVRGYLVHDKVLRYSKVKITKKGD